MPIDIHTRLKLQTAIVKYDQREATRAAKAKLTAGRRGIPRAYHNPYALAHYCAGLERVDEATDSGTSLARALYDNFQGRILTALERAVDLPPTYGGGAQSTGRPD